MNCANIQLVDSIFGHFKNNKVLTYEINFNENVFCIVFFWRTVIYATCGSCHGHMANYCTNKFILEVVDQQFIRNL